MVGIPKQPPGGKNDHSSPPPPPPPPVTLPPSLYRYVNVASCSNSFYDVLLYAHRLDLDRCRPVDQCPVKHQPPLPSLYMYVNVASCSNSFYNVLFYGLRLDLDRCRPVDQCPVKHQSPLPSLYMYVNVASCCNSFYDVILRPQTGSGPVHPIFDKSAFQSRTIGELRALGIRTKTAPGKLDLLVHCPLKGRCPHCIFMTHDSSYVDTLPTTEQIKREFVSCKGNGSHISLRQLLRSELTVAQVERYIEDEV